MALPLSDCVSDDAVLVIVGHTDDQSVVLRTASTHPEHALLGYTLPSRFDALSVFAPSVLSSSTAPRHRPGSLAIRMDRSGNIDTQLLFHDGTVTRASAPTGWLVDACRRTLGLSTDPPNSVPAELAAVVWLDRLMTALIAGPVDWAGAVARAPIPARWRSHDPEQVGIMLVSNLPPWSTIRRSMASGDPGPVALPRRWAEWMDDGMFSRWCVGSFPDLDALRADVEFLAPTEVADGVAQALAAAGGLDPT